MENQEIKVAKLGGNNLICNICGGKLKRILAEETKKLLKMKLEGRIFKCEKCEMIFRITITAKTRLNDLLQWSEEIEKVQPWELNLDEIEEVPPTSPSLSSKNKIFSYKIETEEIGKVFKCEKNGIECDLYYLASCRLGDPEICGPGRKCKYDPYTEEEKKKWYKSLA